MDVEYIKRQRLCVKTKLETFLFHGSVSHITLTEVVIHQSGKKLERFIHCHKSEVKKAGIQNSGSTKMAARTEGIADYSEMIADESKEIADERNGRS
jgi:uncharacterized protein YceH (UPF0502 family)